MQILVLCLNRSLIYNHLVPCRDETYDGQPVHFCVIGLIPKGYRCQIHIVHLATELSLRRYFVSCSAEVCGAQSAIKMENPEDDPRDFRGPGGQDEDNLGPDDFLCVVLRSLKHRLASSHLVQSAYRICYEHLEMADR